MCADHFNISPFIHVAHYRAKIALKKNERKKQNKNVLVAMDRLVYSDLRSILFSKAVYT